jgi:hypothetical protein
MWRCQSSADLGIHTNRVGTVAGWRWLWLWFAFSLLLNHYVCFAFVITLASESHGGNLSPSAHLVRPCHRRRRLEARGKPGFKPGRLPVAQLARRRCLEIVAFDDPPEERDREWYTARKRQLENVVEAAKRSPDNQPRDSELVGLYCSLPDLTSSPSIRLKDSDVTWLYGPFHTSAEHKPLINRSHSTIRSSTPPPSPSHATVALPKPILKHRSVTEVLVAALPTPSPSIGLLDVSQIAARPTPRPSDDSESSSDPSGRPRPPLTHTRSETNLHDKSPFRRDSPPRIIADQPSSFVTISQSSSDSNQSEGPAVTPPSQTEIAPGAKKHISFNTFVEQCIAIDKPDGGASYHHNGYSRLSPGPQASSLRGESQVARRYQRHWGVVGEDPEDDSSESQNDAVDSEEEDDRIEIKPRSRSSSLGISASTVMFPKVDESCRLDDIPAVLTPGREHVTIAPIAPTLLKTSSNSYTSSPMGSALNLTSPRFQAASVASYFDLDPSCQPPGDEEDTEGDVPLLWVPPVGSGYEHEFGLRDLEEGEGLANGRNIGSVTRGSYGLSPSVHSPAPRADYFVEERKGRPMERRRDRKGHRGHDSVSPVETPSSSTVSSSGSGSRSRSRSRNRSEFLSPSPEGRGRWSRSRSRSDSLSRDGESPDDDRQPAGEPPMPEQRGRTMSRNVSHGASTDKRQVLRDREVDGAQTALGTTSLSTKPLIVPGGAYNPDDSDSSETATRSQSNGDPSGGGGVSETITGIRGFIGTIWNV